MSKKPGPGPCVHCLYEFPKRNWDHVLPVSWYPNTTPQNLEKWKVPTCVKCNSDYGKIEEDLFTMLAMTVERSSSSAGIHEKALRSIDPSAAKTKRDRKARLRKRKRVFDAILPGEKIPDKSVYPGLGERWGRSKSNQIGLTVPTYYFERLCHKITRGIHYIETGSLIKPPYEISFFAMNSETSGEVGEAIRKYGQRYARGPGIVIYRAVPFDEPSTSMLEITIFGELTMYSSVDALG